MDGGADFPGTFLRNLVYLEKRVVNLEKRVLSAVQNGGVLQHRTEG